MLLQSGKRQETLVGQLTLLSPRFAEICSTLALLVLPICARRRLVSISRHVWGLPSDVDVAMWIAQHDGLVLHSAAHAICALPEQATGEIMESTCLFVAAVVQQLFLSRTTV